MPEHKLSCVAHRNYTDFNCAQCGFEQADYYKAELDDFQQRFKDFLQQELEAWEHIDSVRQYIETLIERVQGWWH